MGVVWKAEERFSAHPHVLFPCCPGGPVWMALLLLGMFLALLMCSVILGTNLSHSSLPQSSKPSPGSVEPLVLGSL